MTSQLPLQACKRCRRRRIRCDSTLPACGNCAIADVECLLYDDSRQEEIPRSYLYALQKKRKELELAIESASRNRGSNLGDNIVTGNAESEKADYYPEIGESSRSADGSIAGYIGPGNSARLLGHLMTDIIEWRHKSSLPHRLSSFLSPQRALALGKAPLSSIPHFNHKQLELPSYVGSATQRILVEYYLAHIQPIYPLLLPSQEKSMSDPEFRGKWSTINTSHSNLIMTGVMAISAALISRDTDSRFASIASACRNSLQRISEQPIPSGQSSIQVCRHLVLVLCFQAIFELVSPVSGEIWGLVGRALSSMEQLQAEYKSAELPINEDFRCLNLALVRIESTIASHFRRPTRFTEVWLFSNDYEPATDPCTQSLILHKFLYNITQGFLVQPQLPEVYFEGLIPKSLRVTGSESPNSVATATMYLSLHPLFTKSLSNILANGTLEKVSPQFMRYIAESARTVLENYSEMNDAHRLISLWVSAERVLEAGAVWGTYIIVSKRMESVSGVTTHIGLSTAMDPLLKCTSLLSSITERWKKGTVYNEVWQTFMSLLLTLLE